MVREQGSEREKSGKKKGGGGEENMEMEGEGEFRSDRNYFPSHEKERER